VPEHRLVLLRPLLVTRLANTLPGIALAALAWSPAEAVSVGICFAPVAPMLAGVVLVVRGYRMSVVVTDEHVVVRGLLRSRTIRQADVAALTSLPTLRWQPPSGRYAHTPLIMFMELGKVLPAVEAHNEASLDRLARALHRRG
jgi:hypothetical protein